jgi:hypothetical protein
LVVVLDQDDSSGQVEIMDVDVDSQDLPKTGNFGS